jgi:predicted nucleic acid-binding protein
MKIYLDTNAYNRPFDDQTQVRIRLETIAIFAILQLIKSKELLLVWSFLLTYENSLNPSEDIKMEIEKLSSLASENVDSSEDIRKKAKEYELIGIKPRDAIHISCALNSGADYFVTCDDKILRKTDELGLNLLILNPIDFIKEVEGVKNENDE